MAHDLNKKWRTDDVKLREKADFSAMLLSDRVLRGLNKCGFKIPSPIQLEAIPIGRFGKDLLVQAKSGTGKTLVFTVIALEMLRPKYFHPQVLIIAPTREIATQICSVINSVGKAFHKLTCCSFIGGLPLQEDKDRASVCQIIVGTPGRIKQLISLGSIPTKSIRLLVFDEADTLFQGPFKLDIDDIFKCLPENKQVIATSATFPVGLKKIIFHYLRDPFVACLNSVDLALLGIVHYTKIVESNLMPMIEYNNKLRVLEKILKTLKFSQCLVFCNLIGRVEVLCRDIKKWGFSTSFMSSAKEQTERLKVLDRLKHFKCKVLVSTDVTSRGIDVENVDLVINFDLALSTETYLHRVGRAGRYGSIGLAVSIITEKQLLYLKRIEDEGNFKSYRLPDPVPKDLLKNPVYGEYTLQEENLKSNHISDEDVFDSSETVNSKVASNGTSAVSSTGPTACTNSLIHSFESIQSSTNLENSFNVRNSTPNYDMVLNNGHILVKKTELDSAELMKMGKKVLDDGCRKHASELPCNGKIDASDIDKHTNQDRAEELVSEEMQNHSEQNLMPVHSDESQRISDSSAHFHQAVKALESFAAQKDSCGFEVSMDLDGSLSLLENIPKISSEATSIDCALLEDNESDENVESGKVKKRTDISEQNDCSLNSIFSGLKDDIKRFVQEHELSIPKASDVNLANPENSDKPVDPKTFEVTLDMIQRMQTQQRDFYYKLFTKFQESDNISEASNAETNDPNYKQNENRLDIDALTSKNGVQNKLNSVDQVELNFVSTSNEPEAMDSLKANQPAAEREASEIMSVGDAASSKVVNVDSIKTQAWQATPSEQVYETVSSSAESDSESLLSSCLKYDSSPDLSSSTNDTESDASSSSSSESSDSESVGFSDVSSNKDEFIEHQTNISKPKIMCDRFKHVKHSQSNKLWKRKENSNCKYNNFFDNYCHKQSTLPKMCAKKQRMPSNTNACLPSFNCRHNPNLPPLSCLPDKSKYYQLNAICCGCHCDQPSFCCNSHQRNRLPKSCHCLNAMPCSYYHYQSYQHAQPSFSPMCSIFSQQLQYIQGCVNKFSCSAQK